MTPPLERPGGSRRRTAGSALAALLSSATATACAARPWTPSISLVYARPDAPGVRATTPSADDAIADWQLPPSNPWSRYQKFTLLAALGQRESQLVLPDVRALEVVRRAERAAGVVRREGLPPESMWVLDLRGAASVAFGAALSRTRTSRPAALVPTFNHWPDEYELIPAEETLAALVEFEPDVPPADAAVTTPVFLLDAWRLAYRYESVQGDRTDNRYALLPGDLPAPEVLRAQGIRHVVYVVESLHDTEVEEDDVHAAFMAYQQAGVVLHMVDLATLHDLPPTTRLVAALNAHPLRVEPRHVLLDDPAFYAAAHGGFGGVRAAGVTPVHDGAVFVQGARPLPPVDDAQGALYFGGGGGHVVRSRGGYFGGGGGGGFFGGGG